MFGFASVEDFLQLCCGTLNRNYFHAGMRLAYEVLACQQSSSMLIKIQQLSVIPGNQGVFPTDFSVFFSFF